MSFTGNMGMEGKISVNYGSLDCTHIITEPIKHQGVAGPHNWPSFSSPLLLDLATSSYYHSKG
eukprot:scaffold34930_cov191-Amphora_coffeaeformis.AAC.1